MRIKGKITHCEVFFLAGQKNATNGKAGLCAPAFEAISLLVVGGDDFFFFLDLYGEARAAMSMDHLLMSTLLVVC